MDIVNYTISHAVYLYNYGLAMGDPRTANWPLMSSYWPPFLLFVGYLVVVYVGPKLMTNREPCDLRYILAAYNIFLVVFNSYICSELIRASWKLNYNYTCQAVHYGDNPDELRIAKALWCYLLTKPIEFLDTVFIILRKKKNQISFLHVFHHATILPGQWMTVKWVPGGNAMFGATLNSSVHIVMYTYYALAALGPNFNKYLWWKKYMTRIQLSQFVVGMIHCVQSMYRGCPFSYMIQCCWFIYGLVLSLLFGNFYIQEYITRRNTNNKLLSATKPKVLEVMSDANSEEPNMLEGRSELLKHGSSHTRYIGSDTRPTGGGSGTRPTSGGSDTRPTGGDSGIMPTSGAVKHELFDVCPAVSSTVCRSIRHHDTGVNCLQVEQFVENDGGKEHHEETGDVVEVRNGDGKSSLQESFITVENGEGIGHEDSSDVVKMRNAEVKVSLEEPCDLVRLRNGDGHVSREESLVKMGNGEGKSVYEDGLVRQRNAGNKVHHEEPCDLAQDWNGEDSNSQDTEDIDTVTNDDRLKFD